MTQEKVEAIVSEHFGVSVAQLRNNDKGRNIYDARQFTWYVLNSLGYSGPQLASDYNTTRQNINHAVTLIREGIRLQPFYINHLKAIIEEMKNNNII